MTDTPRVAVIGLDCGTPQLLFRDFEAETPNIHALMQRGMWGDLASITPPITVPAWACAMTGKTPGQLGIYGFRNRKDTTYEGLSIATADAISATESNMATKPTAGGSPRAATMVTAVAAM